MLYASVSTRIQFIVTHMSQSRPKLYLRMINRKNRTTYGFWSWILTSQSASWVRLCSCSCCCRNSQALSASWTLKKRNKKIAVKNVIIKNGWNQIMSHIERNFFKNGLHLEEMAITAVPMQSIGSPVTDKAVVPFFWRGLLCECGIESQKSALIREIWAPVSRNASTNVLSTMIGI